MTDESPIYKRTYKACQLLRGDAFEMRGKDMEKVTIVKCVRSIIVQVRETPA